MRYIISLIISIFFFTSCEKVIDLDLNDSDKRLIVEGLITNSDTDQFIGLRWSNNFYEPIQIMPVEKAAISITNGEQTATITEQTFGNYLVENLNYLPGESYSITITADGQSYTSNSVMPQVVAIDSISFIPVEDLEGFFGKRPGGKDGKDGEEEELIPEFSVYIHFTDPINIDNYYRLKVSKNGESIDYRIRVWDDQFRDGQSSTEMIYENFALGDSIHVQLISIDLGAYTFYNTLNELEGQDESGSSPANPNSNINNGAIGCFNVANTSEVEMIVELEL